jgi:alkylation response protein AidB-like acyl-CoA dehydrogenase
MSIRAWLEENCPASMRTPFRSEAEWTWGGRHPEWPSEDARVWLSRMVERGYTAPTWPKEYGGAGLGHDEAAELRKAMAELGCREPLHSFGLWMLGPVLLEFGSDAQKQKHLPPIARAEIRWCQGYSEPGAGSDLASLQTRADLDGDHYVVNGQKIWTSYANKADWIFCLVRTGSGKHDGVSFLLIDMETPGIRVRPIRLISGASPFCETFFDDVRVPVENLVAGPGQGWTVAKSLLKHERALIARARDAATAAEEPLQEVARRSGALSDPVLRDRVTQSNLDFLCSRLLLKRDVPASMLKWYGTEMSKRRKDLRVVLAGFEALDEKLQITTEWLRSRASSIEGGTSEIQLNIIARQYLGLPD